MITCTGNQQLRPRGSSSLTLLAHESRQESRAGKGDGGSKEDQEVASLRGLWRRLQVALCARPVHVLTDPGPFGAAEKALLGPLTPP